MTAVAIVARDCYESRLFIKYLSLMNDVSLSVFLESGRPAKRKKLKKYLFDRWWLLPLSLFNLFFLLIYSYVLSSLMRKGLESVDSLDDKNIFHLDYVNEKVFVDTLNSVNPEVILNYGTGLYRKKTLESIEIPIINFHTGILPKYRNVHTDLWAYLNKDYSGIGITAFQITQKIDAGPILISTRQNVDSTQNLATIKASNILLIIGAMQKIVKSFQHGTPLKVDTSELAGSGPMWPTPNAIDVLKILIKPKEWKSAEIEVSSNP
jgi:methionyl-tRNA formyltransferase